MAITVRILEVSDVTEKYVEWYLDEDITRFSENQYREFSLEGQCEYVASCLASADVDLYGIFDDEFHVGNILISDIHSVHKRSEITFLVGEKKYWRRGVASYAISEMVKLARNKYRLNKLFAGLAEGNVGSQKVLEKNGFILEGRRSRHLYFNGEFCDQLDYGLLLS